MTWKEFDPALDSRDIPRSEMPQISSAERDNLVRYLLSRSVTSSEEEISPERIKPTQKEYSPEKVEQAKSYGNTDRPVLVSYDGRILDGHHQWLANLDKKKDMKVIRFNATMNELLQKVQDFPGLTKVTEEVAANVTGSPTSEKMSMPPAVSKEVQRRKYKVFKVQSESFNQFPIGECHWTRVLESHSEISEYAAKNPNSVIVLENAETGSLLALRRN